MATLLKRRNSNGQGYTWYIRRFIGGKEYWKSCRTADKRLAQEILKKVEAEDERLKQGLSLPGEIKQISLEEFKATYLAARANRFAERTLQTDAEKLELFEKFIGNGTRQVSSIVSREVEKFREKRLKEVKPTTVNISLAHLRAAYQWAEDQGYTLKNPFAIKHLKIRQDKKIPKAMTPSETEAFFNATGEPYKPLFYFIYATGCRRSEALRLTWESLDFQAKTITFTRTKGKKDRALPMTLEVAHLLNTLPRDNDKVFPYSPCWVTHLFKMFRKKAGIGMQYTLHSLRHTCATDLLRSGVSIYTVQKMLGHSSIAVTERYLHALPEDLREAAEVLSKKIKISA